MKIVDKRVEKDNELPKLPFFTFDNKGILRRYFYGNSNFSVNKVIKCMRMEDSLIYSSEFLSVNDIAKDFVDDEQIVNIEIHIVD